AYRQDEYSLIHLLLMANALSLAIFLSGDVSYKSEASAFNAAKIERPASSDNPPESQGAPVEQTQERAVAVAGSSIESPGREKPVERFQKDKVIDLKKVRSKPLVWRFPAN
ncbi:MAG: hypothetical protein L5655_05130, partial [Thermosediminibacteraceae bacterium]|nr:hypothetical protein [Thermosediminibacteraceae bacterium]